MNNERIARDNAYQAQIEKLGYKAIKTTNRRGEAVYILTEPGKENDNPYRTEFNSLRSAYGMAQFLSELD